jgi:hypothetical protein
MVMVDDMIHGAVAKKQFKGGIHTKFTRGNGFSIRNNE